MSQRKSKRLTKAEGKAMLEDKHRSENDLSARFSAVLDKHEEQENKDAPMPPKPSDPVHRPEPAVGQVWRTEDGREFIVTYHFPGRNIVSVVWATVRALTNYHPEYRSFKDTDTYVGQFDGFKVKGET